MSVKRIEELVDKIVSNLPDSLQKLPEDIQKSLKTHLSNTLNKMDIVTREEFDAQKAVLGRTRDKLDILETKIKELEENQAD